MKLSIVTAMLFTSLAAAEIRYFCLKGGDAIPKDEWSCSTADNRACKQYFVLAFSSSDHLLTNYTLL